jgi:predicted HTH domain antitoxin
MTRDDEIVRLYREGKSLSEVGKLVGISIAGVGYVLEKRGVPRRPKGNPRRARQTSATTGYVRT